MANKRSLKKIIHLVCEDLFAEAIALSLYGAEAQQESARALLYSIVKLEDDYVRRISHAEPGIKANDYFKNLRERVSAEINDIVDQMNG